MSDGIRFAMLRVVQPVDSNTILDHATLMAMQHGQSFGRGDMASPWPRGCSASSVYVSPFQVPRQTHSAKMFIKT